LGIFEILLFLIIALIVIPPDDLPQVMHAVGKVLRELRLASNTVMREITSAIGDEAPYNLLPPRFEEPHPPSPSSTPQPAPRAFLAPEAQPSEPSGTQIHTAAAEAPQHTAQQDEQKVEVKAAEQLTSSSLTEPAKDRNSEQPATSETPPAKP
jgi:Sec-independent protein translocase protein TatA